MKKNKKFTVLCVDDDKDFIDSLKIIIEGEGYTTLSAYSAEEGIQKFKQTNPNLVIVDLMMEEIDSGVQFVKELRAAGGKQPVYMLSSVGDKMNINVDASELGLSGFLQKPVNPTTLIATLKAKLK
jgi:two-component system alkaline phosphatase synthesis response regulator PhoP